MSYKLIQVVNLGCILMVVLMIHSCLRGEPEEEQSKRFLLLTEEQTHISFVNQVAYTEEYNTYTYRNFYNGAGVGLGDFNNDGLTDIYFCGNIADNKLYINQGDFSFEDVTEKAGVACPGVWSTGVSIADVNGDGWLDLYICKSGAPDTEHRNNELFINNGDLTFTEKAAEYGIGDLGLSTHASFFDYDRDGDLDCYLLNNSFQSVTEFDMIPDQREIRDSLGGNKLYRNEGAYFTDISEEAGIYGSKIGFGLGVSVGDVNRDGWMDVYISNDFFERDYLYINNRDGTFSESLEEQLGEISLGAMGADLADINNDTYPEIFVTEMTAEGDARLKTKVLFDSWERYSQKQENGYHSQFARNVLQLNNRDGSFSEVGRLSGVNATDWSWGALILDLDNDGWKDIFVANGIYKDLLDRDYLNLYSNPELMRSLIESEEQAILGIIDKIPSVRIPNYAFHNRGDLTFTNLAGQWGLDTPSHSNGAAYGDLDNDGDLDLVVNNVNMPPFIYRNETPADSKSSFLVIGLKGIGANTSAIGASVTVYYGASANYQELIPMRGFKSSMDPRLHFGLGSVTAIDSMVVKWPDGTVTCFGKLAANQFLTIDQQKSVRFPETFQTTRPAPVFKSSDPLKGLDFMHHESDFVDFSRNRLLFHMISNEGPHMAVGDVDGDGLDDLYICGAKNYPGALYLQGDGGFFERVNVALFEADRLPEDTDCAFFDADGDGDLDLYVTSGSNEFPASSSALLDRLYLNDGRGIYAKSPQLLPAGRYESSACVEPADFDNDGDVDLFVGIRLEPFSYGVPVSGYLLENDGVGRFSNVSDLRAPGLKQVGMITDAAWGDVDGDGDLDLVIVGDWMPVKLFINDWGMLSDESAAYGLSDTEGWWNTIVAGDLNSDSLVDFVLGNHGLNSRFKASSEFPVTMYVNDFDLNGSIEQVICAFNGETSFPMAMKDDLVKQLPVLERKYATFAAYSEQTIEDIFSEEVIRRSIVLSVRRLASSVMTNTGNDAFILEPLPLEAQFSPIYAIKAADFDGDGNCDILIGGNQSRAKPEVGSYCASYGLLIKGDGNGHWDAVPSESSGFRIIGELRDMEPITVEGNRIMVLARNNDGLQTLEY